MDPELDIGRPDRPLTLAGIAVTGVMAGAFVGAATNAVNGFVSPTYFINIMQWHHLDNIWRAAVAQGILEGLVCGFFFSMIFTIATGIITSVSCEFRFAFKHLLGIVAAALILWFLGGLTAMGLATLSPEMYRAAFFGVPDDFEAMLAYAWVGGSIWGVQFGGLASLIVGIFFLRANWRLRLREAQG